MAKIDYINDFEQWVKEFSFSIPVKVRFSETDLFGHMNNTVPFSYFEDARIEFFNASGLMKEMLAPDYPYITVVGDLQCHFLKQTYFHDHIQVFVKINYMGNSSFDLHYCAKKEDGDVLFVGRGAIILIERKTGKSVLIPEDLKEKLINIK